MNQDDNSDSATDEIDSVVSSTSASSSSDTSSNSPSDDCGFFDAGAFLALFLDNRPFRLYLLSYVVALCGEWMTYIACLSLIEEIFMAQNEEPPRTAVGVLAATAMFPYIIFSPFSGALADSLDKRQLMISLDIIGAMIPWIYLVALQQESLLLIYMVTFLKYSVGALYEPTMSSILPMLVSETMLPKATTLTEGTYSIMQAVGSAMGGLILGYFGFRACFIIDSFTYMLSASLLWWIGGSWKVEVESLSQMGGQKQSAWNTLTTMTVETFWYLRNSRCGAFVFLKTSGAIMYGASDVLNVAFSEADYTGWLSDCSNALKLGILFACTAVGYIASPIIADGYTRMDRPVTLQKACVCGLGICFLGCLGMSVPLPFFFVGLFSVIRAAGDSQNWIYSALLIQKFSPPDLLGRVTALEYALAYLTEAFAACFCGIMIDSWNLSAHEASLLLGCLGGAIFFWWLSFHLLGRGANTSSYRGETEADCDGESQELIRSTEASSLLPTSSTIPQRNDYSQ